MSLYGATPEPVPKPGVMDLLKQRLAMVVIPAAAMWVVHALNLVMGSALSRWGGIRPHELSGVPGVIFAPLLHADFAHLMGNTASWLVLGSLVALATNHYGSVTATVWVIAGLVTWLLGSPGSVHIGASLVIYGYASYLVAYGFMSRRLGSMILAVMVIVVYSSFVYGLLPFGGISWQGHLGGVIGGIVAALFHTREIRAQRKQARVPAGQSPELQ